MMQVNVAIMLAPVTFLGHITSQPVEAMARMQTDRVIVITSHLACYPVNAAAAALSAALLLLLHCQQHCCCC